MRQAWPGALASTVNNMAFQEPYSNPIAPPDHEPPKGGSKLSNDDFRRLMMTPRAAPTPSQPEKKKQVSSSQKYQERKRQTSDSSWQAMVKKEDEERQAEWAKIYRDRAKERRTGDNPDYIAVEGAPTATTGYNNVAPNVDPSQVARQRKLDIAESKFLGGDMAHTHMVKGLDYALLQKVRSEMLIRDREEEEMKLLERKREKERATSFREQQHSAKKGEITFRTKMAKRLYQTVFDNTPPAKNEFFLPGRMAYVFELNDEYAESDIPTTLLRSKADCPSVEVQTTLSTNDIVINKLTQILSYLRQGSHSSKKNKRKEKGKVVAVESEKKPAVGADSIFADTGDYSAEVSLASAQPPKITSYFNKPLFEAEQSTADIHKSTSDFVKAVNAKYGSSSSATVEDKIAEGWSQAELGVDTTKKSKTARESSSKKGKDKNLGFGGFEVAGHYAECYPGGMEEMDATVNSDDETDYSKMDMGPHKGPVKRWDFDNEDDYSTYQSSREAVPKAAFQYGVKMNDGRKTRRQAGVNKEKAKLDREWQQISQILHKRKSEKLDAVTKRLKSD